MSVKNVIKNVVGYRKQDDLRRDYFDEDFYRASYAFEGDAFEHYCASGWRMGFSPNPFFNVLCYQRENEVKGQEPLLHHVANWHETRFVSPAFDGAGYLDAYPDVALSGMDPFLHYLRHGYREGRAPGFPLYMLAARREAFPAFDWVALSQALGLPLDTLSPALAEAYVQLVDAAFYREAYSGKLGGQSPVDHYSIIGWREGCKPNALFDPEWYARCHGVEGVNPLLHHVLSQTRPVPFFCAKSYLRAHPEVGQEALAFAHFIRTGCQAHSSLGIAPGALRAMFQLEQRYDWAVARQACMQLAVLDEQPRVAEPREYGSLPEARTEADPFAVTVFRSKSRGKALVSFDVWDTLLRRSCAPDEVKLFAAYVLAGELGKIHGRADVTSADLFALRQLAEYRVADQAYEYSYPAMLQEWLALCGVLPGSEAEALAQRVMDAEVAREIAVTRPDPSALAMLEALPAGATVVAVSDFYLPASALKQILAHHDLLRHFSQVFVSCEVMLTKRAGALFDYVLTTLGKKPQDTLHVGDNRHADHEMALRHGLDAYLFVDKLEEKRKEVMNLNFKALLEGDSAQMARLVLCQPPSARSAVLAGQAPEADALDAVSSVDFLALLFAGFARFVLEKAVAAQVDQVFFATREGYFIRRVYDLLVSHDVLRRGEYPRSALLEVSRRATFGASLREVSLDEMMRIWCLYSIQSMQALARSINADELRMADFCTRFEVAFDEPIKYPWLDAGVQAMFDDGEFQLWLSQVILVQREALWAYLETQGFEPGANKKRFMVDIGWRGTIQDNLAFMVNGRLDGAYVALYKYLSEQPANAEKHGYLVDHNREGSEFHVGDFAALEFVANGPGGSVTGYQDGVALKEAFDSEEALLRERIIPLQDRIVARIEALLPLMASMPLTASGWRTVAREACQRYVRHPDQEVADVFQQLEHNETFGVGSVQSMDEHDTSRIESAVGAELHAAMLHSLEGRRWPQAWLNSEIGQGFLTGLSLDRKLVLPRTQSLARAPALVRSLGYQISIYAPSPIRGSGGHRTIYNLAKALDKAGFNVNLFSEQRGSEYAYKEQELAGSQVKMFDFWFSGVIPDLAIATIQHSAPYLSQFFGEDVKKFYFVQDFEAAFNPVSDGFVRGENSFAEGHDHLCIGRWLTHVLRNQYGCGAASAGLGVDTDVYFPLEKVKREKRIAVLYQPEKWRRLPEHCLEALIKVKGAHPDVEIVFYGSGTRPNLPFPFVHMGLVDDLKALNRLYNSSSIGLCISLTNPSRIPYEMMAAGCVPVDVYRYNNLFDYENQTGLLAWQSADSLAAAMIHLLENPAELEHRRENSIASAGCRTLRWEADAAVNALEFVLEGGNLNDLPVPVPSYSDPVFVADSEQRSSVLAWCDWQQKQARFAG